MKRVGIVLILIGVLAVSALPVHSYVASGPETRPITSAAAQTRVAAWTVMVYMAADNDLESFALADLNEMELAGSSEAVNVIVQVDRAVGYDPGDGDWTEARRYFIQQDRRTTSVASEWVDGGTLGETDTSDPATLVDFATWAITTYPAEHYALVIWDHGGSWQGLATDESAGKQDLILPELTGALDQIVANTGIGQLDLVGFDACLMGSFEVYRAIAPYAMFAVASAELIPGDGWDYFGALETLNADPTVGGDVFGRAVVDSFITYYTEIVTKYAIFNLGVVDLSQAARVEAGLGEITALMATESSQVWPEVVAARTQTPLYGAFGDPQFIDIWAAADLIQFAGLLRDQSVHAALAAAAGNAYVAGSDMVVYYRSSADPAAASDNQGGISIYFPRTAKLFESRSQAERYQREFPADQSLWTNFLTKFFETSGTQTNAETLRSQVTEITTEGGQAQLAFDLTADCSAVQATSTVELDIGNGQNIVVDYVPIACDMASVTWEGLVPWLTNGRSETPVLVLRHPRAPNVGVVNGKLYPRNGSPLDAQLVFDLTTNELISVWGLGQSANTVMPSQVVPGQGDIFHPVWLTPSADNSADSGLKPLPANVRLVFDDDSPLRLDWRRAPTGAYQIGVNVEDAAGNVADDAQYVAVTAGDDDTFAIEAVDLANSDADGDGIPNADDNCPVTANADQADFDEDGIGDACDLFDDGDLDGDGIPDEEDACPGLFDPDQTGADCDFFADDDGDGIPDDLDLCPDSWDPFQIDLDGDALGDACDDAVDALDPFEAFDEFGDCDPDLDPDCDFYGVEDLPDDYGDYGDYGVEDLPDDYGDYGDYGVEDLPDDYGDYGVEDLPGDYGGDYGVEDLPDDYGGDYGVEDLPGDYGY